MLKAIISDFSRVLLFPQDKSYLGGLNTLHRELSQQPNYHALDHFSFNAPLLSLYSTLKDKYPIFIFTSESIQDDEAFQPYIQPIFSSVFSAKKLNIDKKNPEAYKIIAQKIGFSPNEVLYIDDNEENTVAATKAGCIVCLYRDFESLEQEIAGKLERLK